MSKTAYSQMFEQTDSEFSGEEITTFKRYIEENNVATDNCFEFYENNLNYYSTRYTSPDFFSPSRLFQTNSNYESSEEMQENYNYYCSSVEWAKQTIHPEDSKYVLKEEKYLYLNQMPEFVRNLIDSLNQYSIMDYHCVDLLIYNNDKLSKFLPGKNFTFTWRKNCSGLIDELYQKNLFQTEKDFTECDGDDIVIIPVFVPIRECLFLGEYGYRDAMILYGQVIERIMNFVKTCTLPVNVRRFDNQSVNKLFHVDGVDKTIMNLIVCQSPQKSGT